MTGHHGPAVLHGAAENQIEKYGFIARETGFGDRERMRRSFLRTFGESPRALRNAAHPLATI
jgi:transcriptional regulator GlxA family with amidase domain